MKSVFQFIDFRRYLAYYYEEKKRTARHFSYRYFSQKAGINSSSFLKQIIEGRRKLTPQMTGKFCKALEFKSKEEVFFRHLVRFNQAKTASEKQEHYSILRSMAGQVKESPLKAGQYDYYNKWYIPVIRELVCLKSFGNDFGAIASCLRPPILPKEAKKALQLLLKLDIIRKNKDGNYKQTNEAISAGDNITSLALRSHIVDMAKHSEYALETFPKTERNISTITLGCSKATYDVLAAEIAAFKDRMKTIISQDKNNSRVYQLNIGLFPVSDELDNTNRVGEQIP